MRNEQKWYPRKKSTKHKRGVDQRNQGTKKDMIYRQQQYG